MQETERILALERQAAPIGERAFEQVQGADDIGLHELGRAIDRAIDVGFGGEVDDCHWLMRGEDALHECAITDIAMLEGIVRMRGDIGQRVGVAGIGQRIEVDDAVTTQGEHVEDEIAADETGTAGDQYSFHCVR